MRLAIVITILLLCFSVPISAATIELDIQGLDRDLRQIVQSALVLPQLTSPDERFNRQRLASYQRQLSRIINEILEPYGYFDNLVNSRLEQPEAEHFRLVVDVVPGAPLRVTSLDIDLVGEGIKHSEFSVLAAGFPLQVGDVLRQDIYETGKAEIRQGAIRLGYLDADFTRHQIRVHLAERTAEIDLQLESGQRYHFGETVYSGSGYPDQFLRRFLSYEQEQPFSYSLLGRTQVNLIDADLFRNVVVRAWPEQAVAGSIPVSVEVDPLPRHRLRPGIGYGTDTGGRVSLNYRLLNLFDRAHELQGRMMIAQFRQTLDATYVIPDFRHRDSMTLLRIGTQREDIDSYFRREIFSEAEYRRAFRRGYSGSLFVRLMTEKSRIADETNTSQLLLPGIRFGRQQVDNPLLPERGYKAQIELIGSDENLLSDTSLIQLTTHVAGLQPLTDRFSFLYRFKGGTTWHKDSFRTLPVSLRYFAGGDRSVRGYKYNSLGPENSDGEVIGGKHVLEVSLELERKLFEKWGSAVFYDVGNAFDNFDDYEIKQGAGIGVRYYTQVGAIRLDLARQIGEERNRLRLHLSVGIGW